jgi:hypothetical protein
MDRKMSSTSPQEEMNRLLSGYWLSKAVYVAAKLGIADLVAQGSRSVDDLARETKTHGPSLYRVLRALASVGVFVEESPCRFSLTPVAACLRSEVPGSQRALAIMLGEEQFRAWSELLYCVQTGKTAFDLVFGMPIFEYLAKNPELAKVFDAAMVSVHGRESSAITDAYDFSDIPVLADIGGGNGSLLTVILQKYPAMRAILYDLPGVTERAKTSLQATGLANRCQVIGGSFFESVPGGADAYLMRHIIHDWDDAKATKILQNVHRTMGNAGRLLVIESVIPAGNDPVFGKLLDLHMLVVPGGKERTEPEYRKLFEVGGFHLTRIVSTRAEVSVIEGRKA